MPENTPIYGFTYPCNSDPITFASFATLANQIDAQAASVQLDNLYATGRYSSRTSAAAQAGVAAGVETALVNAGSTYVVPADGVYWVAAEARLTGAGNITSARLRVRRNAVAQFGRTINLVSAQTQTQESPVVGAMTAVTGDTISLAMLYFGVGPATVTLTRLSIRMLVRVF